MTVQIINTLISSQIAGSFKRKQIIITNLTNSTVTISLGNDPAIANAGITLRQYDSYCEATDSRSECWQGAIQAIGSVASNVAISERFESESGEGFFL